MRFCLVDRVTRWVPGAEAEGVKNVLTGEGVFRDHFPRKPVLPGVLVLEGIQQLACALLEESRLNAGSPSQARLSAFEGVKFRDMLGPGDTLRYHVSVQSADDSGAAVSASARKGDAVVVSCRMAFLFEPGDADKIAARLALLRRAWNGSCSDNSDPAPEAGGGVAW